MDVKTMFFILSVIQGFISFGIGFSLVLKGKFKPQRMTRFLIFIMSLLMAIQIVVGGHVDAVGILIAQTIGSLAFFVVSLKKGVGGYGKLDIFTLISVLGILIVWNTTRNPYLALYLSITADALSFIPTIIKIAKEPATEDWRFYISDVVAAIFGLLALEAYTIDKLAFPMYILVLNLSMSLLIIFFTKKQRFKKLI